MLHFPLATLEPPLPDQLLTGHGCEPVSLPQHSQSPLLHPLPAPPLSCHAPPLPTWPNLAGSTPWLALTVARLTLCLILPTSRPICLDVVAAP